MYIGIGRGAEGAEGAGAPNILQGGAEPPQYLTHVYIYLHVYTSHSTFAQHSRIRGDKHFYML